MRALSSLARCAFSQGRTPGVSTCDMDAFSYEMLQLRGQVVYPGGQMARSSR